MLGKYSIHYICISEPEYSKTKLLTWHHRDQSIQNLSVMQHSDGACLKEIYGMTETKHIEYDQQSEKVKNISMPIIWGVFW